ncbi:hypothetical protein ACVXHB_17995 [Escherichia coli]
MSMAFVPALTLDDPGVQGVDIIHEYTVAAPAAGLSREQIRQHRLMVWKWLSSALRKNAHCEKVAAK